MSRSSKKGPFVDERLMRRIEDMNRSGNRQMIKTSSRYIVRGRRRGKNRGR
jgi:small subunit ribosomal protein S19